MRNRRSLRPAVLMLAALGAGAVTVAGRPAVGDPASPVNEHCFFHGPVHGFDLNALRLDCLNDDVEAPAAFEVTTGTLSPSGQVAFHVYATFDHAPFYQDVTCTWDKRVHYDLPGRVRARIRPARGSREVSGTFRLDRGNPEGPRVVFTPRRLYPVPRDADIEFAFQLFHPVETYRTHFHLHIPVDGTRRRGGGAVPPPA